MRSQILELALDQPELSPRELAVRFTDTKSYFVSEASVYRLLKAHDLITSPAFVVIKAADEFKDLEQIGIPRATFYRWYDLYETGGPDALEDRSPRPNRVWNRIPDDVRSQILELALDQPEL